MSSKNGSSTSSGISRIDKDLLKLIANNHEVEITDSKEEIIVTFHGPKGTVYESGIWKVLVLIPSDYPYKPPSIIFTDTIYHPNIHEDSGAVCLDVIQNTWTPIYDLTMIFDIFLPHLLSYPNAYDALNADAAALYLRDIDEYNSAVGEYITLFASKKKATEEENESQQPKEDSDLSEISEEAIEPLQEEEENEEGMAAGNESLI